MHIHQISLKIFVQDATLVLKVGGRQVTEHLMTQVRATHIYKKYNYLKYFVSTLLTSLISVNKIYTNTQFLVKEIRCFKH